MSGAGDLTLIRADQRLNTASKSAGGGATLEGQPSVVAPAQGVPHEKPRPAASGALSGTDQQTSTSAGRRMAGVDPKRGVTSPGGENPALIQNSADGLSSRPRSAAQGSAVASPQAAVEPVINHGLTPEQIAERDKLADAWEAKIMGRA